MAKSQEETINGIRERIIQVIMELEDFRKESGIHSPRIRHAAFVMEFLAVDFERLVNSIPVGARS